jgi:hypothetical protein
MTNWQGPEYAAQVNLYDVAATPRVNQPVIFEAHYGPLMLEIHVNPSCGIVCPPSVMSNEAVVLLQRPAPGESVKIGVKYMPISGNILINELTDPKGIVLEARSGRRYAPEAIGEEEFLSNPAAVELAMDQSQNNRTQREILERAMHRRALNDKLNPPRAPVLVLSGCNGEDHSPPLVGCSAERQR